jgi:NhaP-type Na+/H+ or K+/H+ antiporter
VLALIAIGVVRPAAMWLVLHHARMSNIARAFIGWFGPRGLNSLLLALLVVQAGAPGAEMLFTLIGVIVLVSVILHGMTATPFASWYGQRVAQTSVVLAEERESTAVGLFQDDPHDAPRISVDELAERLAGPQPPVVLDVRARAQYEQDTGQIPGSVRVPPDQVEEWVTNADRARAVVAYCT